MTHSYGRIMLRLGMDSPIPEPINAPDKETKPFVRFKPDYDLLARMVIREGKPFNVSALMAGYSHAVASRGLKALVEESAPASEAIKRETDRQMITLEKVKPLAVARLVHEIADYKSPFGMKAIELAGRFRETDWFVRNTEVQLGIYMGMVEHVPDVSEPDKFKE